MKYRARENSILHDPDVLPFTRRLDEAIKKEAAARKSGHLSIQIVDENIEAMRLLINTIRTKRPLVADLMGFAVISGVTFAMQGGGSSILSKMDEWVPEPKEVWE